MTPHGIAIIRRHQARTQPWRNGGGITHEILSHGHDEQILWRISIAEIARDGAFSRFPGLLREQVLLTGAGFCLHSPSSTAATPLCSTPEQPQLAFDGETALECRLLDGHVTVFNLMWAPHVCTARLWRRPLVGASSLFAAPNEHWLFHLICGSAQLPDLDTTLSPGDTLHMHSPHERLHQRIEASGSAIVIRIT